MRLHPSISQPLLNHIEQLDPSKNCVLTTLVFSASFVEETEETEEIEEAEETEKM